MQTCRQEHDDYDRDDGFLQEDSEFSFNTSVDTGERERAKKKERHLAGRTNREAVSTGGGGVRSIGYFHGSVLIGKRERTRRKERHLARTAKNREGV